MSRKIVLRAGFQTIAGPEFRPAALTKGPKLLGHVFNVEEVKDSTKTVILGHCGKQTSVKDRKTRKVELELDSDRKVVSAHCSCVAGVAGNCKHTCALVVYVNSERTQSQTDEQCQWYKPSEWGQKNYPKGEEVENIYNLDRTPQLTFSGPTKDEQQDRLELLRSLGDTSSQMYMMLNAKEPEEEVETLEELPEEALAALESKDRPFHFCIASANVIKNIRATISPDLEQFYEKEVHVTPEVCYWICR